MSRKQVKENVVTVNVSDTISETGVVLSDTNKTSQKNNKNTFKGVIETKAIIHNAPNQSEIDSIKDEKLKNKKK